MHYADRANILAVKLLLRQRRLSLPVDPFCLECGGKVVVDSVQHFSGVVGMKPQDFLCEQSEDCFAVLYRGRHFILYNRGVLSLSRRRWSIAHELGHICCRHQSDGPAQEAEANAFAASLLAPTVVVCELQRRGTIRQMQDLCDLFGLSMQAAQYRWGRRQLHLCDFSRKSAVFTADRERLLGWSLLVLYSWTSQSLKGGCSAPTFSL